MSDCGLGAGGSLTSEAEVGNGGGVELLLPESDIFVAEAVECRLFAEVVDPLRLDFPVLSEVTELARDPFFEKSPIFFFKLFFSILFFFFVPLSDSTIEMQRPTISRLPAPFLRMNVMAGPMQIFSGLDKWMIEVKIVNPKELYS